MNDTRYLVAALGRSRISHRNMFVAVGVDEMALRLHDLYERCRTAKLYKWSFEKWLIAMYGRGYAYDSVRVFRFSKPESDPESMKLEEIWKMLDLEAPVAQ